MPRKPIPTTRGKDQAPITSFFLPVGSDTSDLAVMPPKRPQRRAQAVDGGGDAAEAYDEKQGQNKGKEDNTKSRARWTEEAMNLLCDRHAHNFDFEEISQALKSNLNAQYSSEQVSSKLSYMKTRTDGQERLDHAKELVARQAKEAQVDPLDRLFSGQLMEKDRDTNNVVQACRSFNTRTGGCQPGQSWCDELAHLVVGKRIPQVDPRYEKVVQTISNGLRDSKDCFDLLTSLDHNLVYKITCTKKGADILNSSPCQFNSIGELKREIGTDFSDLRYHVKFMGDDVIEYVGRVAVSQLATKYILRQPERQEDEQDRNDGRGGWRRMDHDDDRGDRKRREVGKGIPGRA